MADEAEPEKEWDPEEEKRDGNLQRNYLKLAKEFMEDMKAEKESRQRAEVEAKKKLLALQERMAAEPQGGPAFVGAYRVATYAEVVKRLEVCWADTKRIVGDAPPDVQTAVFHTLMQARGQEEAGQVGEGPPAVAFGP